MVAEADTIAPLHGQAYTNDAAFTNAASFTSEQVNIPLGNPLARMTISVEGGTWEYGVKWGLTGFYQFSDFNLKKRSHRTTAFMNDNWSYSSWVSSGWARASTKAFGSYDKHNSYYDVK
ncbi:hypothetical protein [Schleiferilactobacillus shenzhenensis]|uniref:Uncharacterized protein n=1 Tax=Schleiferilactobacillus shenzhenensis LY-73 TaxID=1231336 RepID=U4TSB1_9LACO|nr:hypothetical protein [Schleiferilactobacillus shenzhenensis]ERL64367.1 hypothetical protein L248_1029 [Schleiferilactobacillus shenzhenensis LY-73]